MPVGPPADYDERGLHQRQLALELQLGLLKADTHTDVLVCVAHVKRRRGTDALIKERF